jgi:hypothetical protein
MLPYKDFTATSASSIVTVTNNSSGTCTSASNFNVGGLSIVTTQSGTGPGNYVVNDADNLTLAIKKLDEDYGQLRQLLDSPNYAEVVEIVASGATPPTSLNGPVLAGTTIYLPNNSRFMNAPEFYTVGKGTLQVSLNGQYLDLESTAYAEIGAPGTASNQIIMNINLLVGDELEFRVNAAAAATGVGEQGVQGPPGPTGPAGPTGATGQDAAGGPVSISIKTGNYSVLSTDCFLAANCASNSVTLTLPSAAANPGRIFYAKKIDSNITFAMVIAGSGGDTIDGAASVSTTVQYSSFSIISNGSSWWLF